MKFSKIGKFRVNMKTKEELETMSTEELLEYKQQCQKQNEFFMMMSDLTKLNLNSLYGAISNPYCRFYTIYCAASTTMSGQMIERHQLYMGDKIVKEDVRKKHD